MFDFLFFKEDAPLLFTQSYFWVFFAVILLIYQFIYKQLTLRNVFLMLASMYFYYLSSGYFFLLLVFSTLVDYYIGAAIYASNSPSYRKFLVISSVFINLIVLAYFKYTYFFVDGINHLFETTFEPQNYLAILANFFTQSQNFDIDKIILPVGISFYTFQTISYSVDIYRRQLKPVNNIWDFAFYVSFFPQLVAGPIVRASDFVPQIYQAYYLSQAEFGRAIFLIINGLVKKIIISDYISINFVDRVFSEPAAYSGFENLMAVYGYAIQIYCDFSGYTDIAIGISLLLGFRLSLNFNSPYKAYNITDFWRRWHISLSSWLRDYLYISMGGNRKGKFKTYLFLFLTMLLGGLWHGAHIRFVIWGMLHGTALAIHKVFMEFFPLKKSTKIGNVLAGILTFHFVCFCWIFFRAENMSLINEMLYRIIFMFRADLIGDFLLGYDKIFAVMLIAYLIHWLPTDWKFKVSENFTALPDLTKAIILVAVALFLFQFKSAEVQPFIYFNF